MRRFVRAGLVVLVMLAGMVLPTTAAQACLCAQMSDDRAFRSSDAVFYGEVVRRSPSKDDLVQDTFTHTIEVDRVYKGDVAAKTRLIAGGNSNSCGIRLVVGESYLVFASTSKSQEVGHAAPDVYTTSLCSGTRSATEASTDFGGGEPPSGALTNPAAVNEGREPVDDAPPVLPILIAANLLLVLLGVAVVAAIRISRRRETS